MSNFDEYSGSKRRVDTNRQDHINSQLQLKTELMGASEGRGVSESDSKDRITQDKQSSFRVTTQRTVAVADNRAQDLTKFIDKSANISKQHVDIDFHEEGNDCYFIGMFPSSYGLLSSNICFHS